MRGERRIALANLETRDPARAGEAPPYEGLSRALRMTPDAAVTLVEASGLRGRGGAGFPSGVKMRAALSAPGAPKYVVVNADEGEPGTFKDRLIMERDPHLLVEGTLCAARAVGAARGYVYIRGEYARSIAQVTAAVGAARDAGRFAGVAPDPAEKFDVEIKIGAGSYLCGEELTLLESLEGKRGHPRIKPPFPAEAGLFGRPTLVHNVETLAHLPAIFARGAAWYRGFGVPSSPGTKIFNVSGDVLRPGSYETDLGVPLRDLVEGFAGGLPPGRTFRAALLGGAAGTFVDAAFLDCPMDYDALRARGATLGSGAVIVLDDTRSVPGTLLWCLEFFAHESCGKCVPCRVGCRALERTLADALGRGTLSPELAGEMVARARGMAASSLCPLGASPVLPLQSALERFPEAFAARGSGVRA